MNGSASSTKSLVYQAYGNISRIMKDVDLYTAELGSLQGVWESEYHPMPRSLAGKAQQWLIHHSRW
jgi:hypothetical protein